jgi:hypothetical protein
MRSGAFESTESAGLDFLARIASVPEKLCMTLP